MCSLSLRVTLLRAHFHPVPSFLRRPMGMATVMTAGTMPEVAVP